MGAKDAVAALGALAHEHRLLVEAGPDGLPAGVIAKRLGLVPSSVTFHLQALLHAGLVTQHRLSRQVIYAKVPIAMKGLMAYLSEHCCDGQTVHTPACQPEVATQRGRKTSTA